MDANKEIRTLIEAKSSGKNVPVMNLIESSPALAAVLSKLNSPVQDAKTDQWGNRTITSPNQSSLGDISQDIAQKATDNENVLQIFPELKQAIMILVNGVQAPKDLNSTEINFSLAPEMKVAPLANKLIPIVEKYLSKDFKLKEELSTILYNVLAIEGSHPIMVIPESSVDDMINDRVTISTESIAREFGSKDNIRTLGLLGDSDFVKKQDKEKNISFESIVSGQDWSTRSRMTSNVVYDKDPKKGNLVDTGIRVTDNIDILKFPKIIQSQREQEINQALGNHYRSPFSFGIEDINNPNGGTGVYGSTELTDRQLTQLLYKDNPNIRNVTRKVKTSNETSRYNVGIPLAKVLPAESVIPICRSGNKKEHVAYFVILDGMGNAISRDAASGVYDEFRRSQNQFKKNNSNLSSHLLQRTADAFSTSCDTVTYQQMQKICSEIIETDFLSRLRNGVFGDDLALVDNATMYDILLSRMFRNQQTQVLFVPASLLTYFHYKLRKNGTGQTLLEEHMVINTLRAVLLFANVNRSVINSIGRTEAEITIDETDPNKLKTIEIMKHEALKTRMSQALPATISPTDINDWLKTSNIYFKLPDIKGLPNTTISFNETTTNYTKPDTDLSEMLDKKAVSGVGVPPELVSSMEQVEFATNIIANNLRLNKTIIGIQEAIQPHMTKFARTFCMNHGDAVVDIENIIRENIDLLTKVKEPDELVSDLAENENLLVKLLAREFLSNFEVNLSRPDTITLKNQLEAFEQYEEGIDKAIKYWLSEDILSSATSGDITAEQIGLIQNSCKSYFIREWLKKSAVLPELFDVVHTDEDGKTKVDIFTEVALHANTLTLSINDFLKKVVPVAQASQRDMETVTGGEEMDGVSSSDSGSSSSDDDSDNNDDGGDDDGGGGDDFDFDMPSMDDF